MALCEGSVIYIFLVAPKLFGHAYISKSLPHVKIQHHFPRQSSSVIFQSFCQREGIVKEVLARSIQMSWNFAHSLIWSPPPICSPIQSSMWAQDQIFDSGNIFRSWSKCILYCLKNSHKLPDHDPTNKTSLHPIWDHFNEPFNHQNYSNFLDREDACEASTILACSFGMRFLQHLCMSMSWGFAKLHPIP